MNELPRLILTRDHVQQGVTPKELATRCKSGALVRVRQGNYVDGKAWRALRFWEQYRLRVSAAAEAFLCPDDFREAPRRTESIERVGRFVAETVDLSTPSEFTVRIERSPFGPGTAARVWL
ncbi:hypothetical protein ACQCSU_07635 [Pseudarthrobacter sp. O4]|uniref:hypothetical protein n=1 Tax=Pseudarthrobacter sp. O4 TaxID=3418417 RepID=UPI003CF226C1